MGRLVSKHVLDRLKTFEELEEGAAFIFLRLGAGWATDGDDYLPQVQIKRGVAFHPIGSGSHMRAEPDADVIEVRIFDFLKEVAEYESQGKVSRHSFYTQREV